MLWIIIFGVIIIFGIRLIIFHITEGIKANTWANAEIKIKEREAELEELRRYKIENENNKKNY